MAGKLFVVATPLGNLLDLSERANQTLRDVALIACEDTRRTARLLAVYEIRTPTISCHRFNEHRRLDEVLARMGRDEDVALVSDGGTPVVSDPGAQLIRASILAGVDVVPIPGPSAVTAVLSVCGWPGDRFVFDGFLPHRPGERRRRLRELRPDVRPVVLFESPHRIRESLADLDQILGDRAIVLGRELTKMHESILRGTARQLLEKLPDPVRGEITLVVAAADPAAATDEPAEDEVRSVWRSELAAGGNDRRTALRTASRRLGVRKAELQRLLMELGEEG